MVALVTLTSDFGTRDSYVAEMKGVLLSEGPSDLRLVDLSHDLPPFDTHAAALFLRAAITRFPRGTIHLVVVDPGVGSARAPIIACTRGQYLVGPDNGVFGYLFERGDEVFAIDPQTIGDRIPSSTFHGRDIFAPIAARLAGGVSPQELGTRVDTYNHMVFPMVEMHGDVLSGRIIHVDHYGNLITNVQRSTLLGFLADSPRERVLISVADRTVRGIVDYYAEAELEELLALFGSQGLLEVAAREANAAAKLGASVGAIVRLTRA
jgi:S-adenosylmethionine hydrolase